MNTESAKAAQFAYRDLVAQIHQRHMQHGLREDWQRVSQLPRLDHDDLAICLAADTSIGDDAGPDMAALAAILAREGLLAARAYISDCVLTRIAAAVRQQLLKDLQGYAEDQESARATAEAARMGMTSQQYAEHMNGGVR